MKMVFPSPVKVALAAGFLAGALAVPVTAQSSVGVVADRGRANPARVPYVHVFDPVELKVIGSVAIPIAAFASLFDLEISPDLGLAFVSDFDNSQIWVIDLKANPPALAAGINPIVVAGPAPEDIVLTPDGKYLITGTGNVLAEGGSKLSVIDVAKRVEASTFDFAPNSPIAVEAAPDGSVLVSELLVAQPGFSNTNVRRLRIDRHGKLTDTGDRIGIEKVPGVHNLLVPSYPLLPDPINRFFSRHTVHISRPAGQQVGSLRSDGLTVADTEALPYPTGIDMAFDPLRSILYLRSVDTPVAAGAGLGNSLVEARFFNPLTGDLGHKLVSIALERRAGTAFGVEQMAVDPWTRRVFVSGLAAGEVRVFDSLTGTQVGTITHPDFLFGTGLTVRSRIR